MGFSTSFDEVKKNHLTCINKFYIASWLAVVICSITMGFFKLSDNVATVFLLVFLIFYLVMSFLTKSIVALTTVRGFFTTGIATMFIVFISLYLVVAQVLNSFGKEIASNNYIWYAITCGILSFVWSLYSSICNAKVATLCNAVITVLFGVLLEIKNLAIPFLLSEMSILSVTDIKLLEQLGYNEAEFLDIATSLLIFPLFFMLAIATIVCAIKQYWINKYNDNNDIKPPSIEIP